MHCIAPSRSGEVDLVLDMAQTMCTLLYPVGKSMEFDRGLTKSMHCIVPSQSRGVERFRQGSYEKCTVYYSQ